MITDFDRLQVAKCRQEHSQIICACQFIADSLGIGPEGGESCVPRWNKPISAKRQPEDERTLPEILSGSVHEESGVSGIDVIPSISHVIGDVDVKKRIDDYAERLGADNMDDERVAKMEHSLLAKSEFADGGAVGGLDALPERQDTLPVLITERPIVDYQKPGASKQRIAGFRPTGAHLELETT